MSTDLNQRLTAQLGTILERHVGPIFKPGAKLTIIARTPDYPDADVFVSNDDIDEVAALVERSKLREATPETLVHQGRTRTRCPKCRRFSGDDWAQCGGACPMPGGPHYVGG